VVKENNCRDGGAGRLVERLRSGENGIGNLGLELPLAFCV